MSMSLAEYARERNNGGVKNTKEQNVQQNIEAGAKARTHRSFCAILIFFLNTID